MNSSDVISGVLLMAYNAFIILYVSRRVSDRFGAYVARKVIHLLSGGVSLALAPLVFSDWYAPLLLGSAMVLFTLAGHLRRPFKWFQIRNNYADVYFVIACTALLVGFWNYNVWIGVLSSLFLAWGDGLTGVVRNFVYKKRTKGWWGNIAMFLVCMALGYFMRSSVGYAGFIGGAFASIVEKFEVVDDNILIPFGSAFLITLVRLL